MANNKTIFQRLNGVLRGRTGNDSALNRMAFQSLEQDKVLYQTSNKDDYDKKLRTMSQEKLLSMQWIKAGMDNTEKTVQSKNQMHLLYYDCDLMDAWPEIHAALDIMSEEACTVGSTGKIINVSSSSERIRSILEDLFVNRLNVNIMLPMIVRGMCKYGNEFMLLNCSAKDGILGWRELPTTQMERIENGMTNPNVAATMGNSNFTGNPDDTQFVWIGKNESLPYKNWQVAHFRLLSNSFFLPYGMSVLHGARRAWKMLSIMEDMMLIYRLERSIERRVFKIFVGNLDPQDVPAYVQQIANNFKRTPIIDPLTGQIDLRKNFMPVWKNTPIPLLDGRTITIEDLAHEYENGKINYVYSIQDKTHKIVPGKVVWCGKNYTANKMIKITLDDDTFMAMAPEHEVVMRDGNKKRADKLVIGESVMPFYCKKSKKHTKKYTDRYEQVYNPNSGKYEYTHRLIAQYIQKDDETYNTVHHINFNRYDNTPTNLKWCDYYEHRLFHQKLIGENWSNPEIRNKMINNMREYHKTHEFTEERRKFLSDRQKNKYKDNGFPKDIALKISETLKNKYLTDTEFYSKMKKAWVNSDKSYTKNPEYIEKKRIIAKENFNPTYFYEYNHSELHKEHNTIRSNSMKKFWVSDKKNEAIIKMTIKFDDFIWNEIRESIINRIIYNRKTLLEYINTHLIEHLLEINTNKRLHKIKKISREVLENRIKEIGFDTITEYISEIKKNHKIKKIEWIDGDDVYCMSVVGLNGEDDRHNFALKTIYENGNWCDNGCFVSNSVDSDYFIPVRTENAPTPIESLPAAQNITAMDDINYMENKVLSALRIPKSFLNFQEPQGKGQNLSIMDIRFSRKINKIQQAVLMELNKIAITHLYLLGFTDDLTNFSLSMNNPSTQIESMELENLQKKIQIAQTALADPGNGIPIFSMHRTLREVMKMSDKEIADNINEIRLEKALVSELEKTPQIIKRTGIFDPVDNIYGEVGAEYSDNEGGEEGGGDDMGSGGPGGFGGGADFGSDLDSLGEPGSDDLGDIGGDMGDVEMSSASSADEGAPAMESIFTSDKPLITEVKLRKKQENKKENIVELKKADIYNKNFFINEELNHLINELNEYAETNTENNLDSTINDEN